MAFENAPDATLPAIAYRYRKMQQPCRGGPPERPNQVLDQAMSAYADGQVAAFDILMRGLEPRVKGFLARISGSSSLADDLAQETFLQIHRARRTFVRGNPVIPWAIAIARNRFISFTRSPQNTQVGPIEGLSEDLQADLNDDPAYVLGAGQIARVASEELEKMPADHRQAFLLLRCEGLSVAAAAGTIGISEGAVKIRAFRAYAALRHALNSHDMLA